MSKRAHQNYRNSSPGLELKLKMRIWTCKKVNCVIICVDTVRSVLAKFAQRSIRNKTHEQWHFYVNKAKQKCATFVWNTSKTRHTPVKRDRKFLVQGPPQFLKKSSGNAGANENLSCGFSSILGIAPGVAPRILVFVLLKSWDAIPRVDFRIPRREFRIPRAAPRISRNAPRAPRMAFSLRERFSWNWGGSQASENSQRFLTFSFLKGLKNEMHTWIARLAWIWVIHSVAAHMLRQIHLFIYNL